MTGKIRLYNQNNRLMRSLFFNSKEDVKKIVERWRNFYGYRMENGYYHIIPYVHEARVINIDVNSFINTEKKVVNEVEMTDYIRNPKTWYHKLYYAGEK
jgi:hypothetical protein